MRINSTFLSDYHEQTNVTNLAKEIDAIFKDLLNKIAELGC